MADSFTDLVDLDLQSPDHRTVAAHSLNFEALNPGFVEALECR